MDSHAICEYLFFQRASLMDICELKCFLAVAREENTSNDKSVFPFERQSKNLQPCAMLAQGCSSYLLSDSVRRVSDETVDDVCDQSESDANGCNREKRNAVMVYIQKSRIF